MVAWDLSQTFLRIKREKTSVRRDIMLSTLVASSVSYSLPNSNVASSTRSTPATSPLVLPKSASDDRTTIGTLNVPNIGLGTIAWTPETPEDEAKYSEIARAAKSAGLNLFDTAERYGAKPTSLIPAAMSAVGIPVSNDYLGGDTESRLATWAEGGTVITKMAPTPWRGSAQSIVTACKGSAARLGSESVDLMQIHMPDIIQPFKAFGVEKRNEEAHWDGLAECYLSGVAKNVGVSNYGPTLLARCQEHLAKRGVPLASNQIHLNLLYRRQGSLATVEAGKELGVKTLAYYPLAMGLLTGKLTPASLAGKKDVRSRELLRYLQGGTGGGFPNTAGDIPAGGIRPLLVVLQEVAARVGKTPAQVSLNWIISKGAIPIPGASSVLQVQENAGALGWRLSHEDVALLDAAADSLPFEFRGCGFQTASSKFVGYGFEEWRLD